MRTELFSNITPRLTRRGLLIGAAAGGGLAVALAFWPRQPSPNVAVAPGETLFNAFLKIGNDGHVSIVAPEVELGQGSHTLAAQLIADELGADWRTIAVESAPISAAYANRAIGAEWHERPWPLAEVQGTGPASTLPAFEAQLREAGAAARVLLCMAAARRWDADWQACDTAAGFVVRGDDRLRFGALATAAATETLPDPVALRRSGERLVGRGLARLDLPAKLDGSVNYAGDIRLPDMVFAALRQGPVSDSRLVAIDKAAAEAVSGVIAVVEHDHWVAAVANNWWAANRALGVMHPRFSLGETRGDDTRIEAALAAALDLPATRVTTAGDVDALFADPKALVVHDYAARLAPHAALEPMTATVQISDGTLQLWIATQLPALARAAAARAAGLDEANVIVHATQVGGSFGRKYEVEIAAQASVLAVQLGRPVQLTWSRAEDMQHDRFRPAARARLSARLGGARIDGWRAKIATSDGVGELMARTHDGRSPAQAQAKWAGVARARAVAGAIPAYGIATLAIDHAPVDLGIATGVLRGGTHGFTAFFTESFVDELARESGVDPFSFRMGMLGGNPRLALCLSRASARGGWEGGMQGVGQGIACHAMLGSQIALLAEASIGDDQAIKVTRLTAVADIGRVLNPDIARQQIEGGLLYGMGLALGAPVRLREGQVSPLRLGALGLPRLADMPEISVELIRSNEAPGDVGELAVSVVAPAIANAIAAGSGQRLRTLPLSEIRA